MNKIDFILATLDFFEESQKWHCDSSEIVGSLGGRSFEGETKEEAAQKMIEYFDKEVEAEKLSLVKRELLKIGWDSQIETIEVSDNYLIKNLASRITYIEFKAFQFMSNSEAIDFSFKQELQDYTSNHLIEICNKVFNVSVDSYQEALEKIDSDEFHIENWEKMGNEKYDFKGYFKKYYEENYSKEELQEILDSMPTY